MKDIQNEKSPFDIHIKTVGITNVKLPIFILQKDSGFQHTVANIDVFVDLDKSQKGIHMSRLQIELQQHLNQALNKNIIIDIANQIEKISECTRCEIIYKFPYFIKKIAPVSKLPGLTYNNVVFDVIVEKNKEPQFIMSVETIGTSLCPCSKEISANGAHNQRSRVKVTCDCKTIIYIEDILTIINKNLSCQIYSVLKREDEKYVTEFAYNNPMFVEDISRSIFAELDKEIKNEVNWFEVEVENEESIHQHNAYAYIHSVDFD